MFARSQQDLAFEQLKAGTCAPTSRLQIFELRTPLIFPSDYQAATTFSTKNALFEEIEPESCY